MTPTRTRIALALVGAALSAAAWTSGAAAADRIEVSSRATLARADPFHGMVLSERAACERNRQVQVYRADPGPDGLYGGTKSDARGRWSVPAGLPNGKFYAVAKKRAIAAQEKTLVCKRAVSAMATF